MMTETNKDLTPRVIAVLPTYRRLDLLISTLKATIAQTRPPEIIVIVDNENCANTKAAIESLIVEFPSCDLRYVSAPDNLGSAGGWEFGIKYILPEVQDADWIMTLDDDDPPQGNDHLEKMYEFANQQRTAHERLGAVGIVGARFNWQTGYLERLDDQELVGAVPVDYVGSNHLAMYSGAMMRDEGVFFGGLFFGHTEVEYCLRMRGLGYEFRANGEMWMDARRRNNRVGIQVRPDRQCKIHWKRYYVTRNYIYMMRNAKKPWLALKRALIQVFAKPLYTLPSSPRRAFRGFCMGLRAAWDGYRGNMGKTVDPATFRS